MSAAVQRLIRSRCVWVWLMGASACCRADGPPPALHVAVPTASESPGSADRPRAPESVKPRDLWFAGGPARAAILARERQDHARAVVLLDDALAREDLSAGDRAAAELLRGLEDLRLEQYGQAADRFARAETAVALGPIRIWLMAWQAQARLDAAEPVPALRLVERARALGTPSPLDADFLVIEADSRMRTRDPQRAQAIYRRYLTTFPRDDRRLEVETKLARALVLSGRPADLKEAVTRYEAVLSAVPLSEFGAEAQRRLPKLRRAAGVATAGRAAGVAAGRADMPAFERGVALARMQALVDHRRYKEAVKLAKQFLRRRDTNASERCVALYSQGSGIFKQRKRAEARPSFERASRVCTDAGKIDLAVKSRYQAARGLYAEQAYVQAAGAFESLAADHADHSYADDAWLLAAESWMAHGTVESATAALRQAIAVGGDMRSDARRRLVLNAFVGGDATAALALADAGIAEEPSDPQWYYARGRALRDRGDAMMASDAFVRAIELDPLGYTALQSLSRLRDLGSRPLRRGLARLTAPQDRGGTEERLRVDDRARRALVLARLGLGRQVAEELAYGGVDGWPAVAVLNQAGLYAESQRLLGGLGSAWRRVPPTDNNRDQWFLAQPRPFKEVVLPLESTHRVPSLLTFAIMQTESRFDPHVTSWAGARGLVQLMPVTARDVAGDIGFELELDDLFNPQTNLELGTRHLGQAVSRYGGDNGAAALAVAAYNAGAGAVARWVRERGTLDLDLFIESIPYEQTRNYTKRVLGRWFAYRWLYGSRRVHDRVPLLPRATVSIPTR